MTWGALRERGLGWSNVWAHVVALVVEREDARFETFAQVCLQPLRHEFHEGHTRRLHAPLDGDEQRFARQVVFDAFQCYQEAMHGSPGLCVPRSGWTGIDACGSFAMPFVRSWLS